MPPKQPELRISPRTLRLITAQIVIFCGYYIFVAFKLSGNPLEINTYPFSSWGMFSEIRDTRSYSVHKPWEESGIRWELHLSDRFRAKQAKLEKRLMWQFLQHRSLAAKPEIDRPKIDAIVRQAYDFILPHVDGPTNIKAIRMYHTFFRIPAYPAEPYLEVARERLLGQIESTGTTPPKTALK